MGRDHPGVLEAVSRGVLRRVDDADVAITRDHEP